MMQTNNDKQRKPDSLQAIVQTDRIGFYPLNSLAVSALHYGQAHCIIGAKNDPQSETLRSRQELTLANNVLNIQGNVFAGICDAFYRGKLPELMIVTANMAEIPDFIEEFMDFLEKLCALGFLAQKETADEVAILDRYIPQIIIASYGLVFDVILEKFQAGIQNLAGISARQKERLLQKLSRSIFTSPQEGYDTQLLPLSIFSQPLALNFAGSKSLYTIRATQLLENNRIPYQFNPNGELGILEWELNLVYKHIIHRILPILRLTQSDVNVTDAEVSEFFSTLEQSIGILPGLTTLLDDTSPVSLDPKTLSITAMDVALLHRLRLIALNTSMPQPPDMLDELIEAVKHRLESSFSSCG